MCLLIQDNLFIMYVEEVMKPCLPNYRVRMRMNKIKRNWYKKKRIWFFAVMPIIWFVLYWNFPGTILVLSMPFLVLLGLYLVVVYLIFLYCILFNKNPMNWWYHWFLPIPLRSNHHWDIWFYWAEILRLNLWDKSCNRNQIDECLKGLMLW